MHHGSVKIDETQSKKYTKTQDDAILSGTNSASKGKGKTKMLAQKMPSFLLLQFILVFFSHIYFSTKTQLIFCYQGKEQQEQLILTLLEAEADVLVLSKRLETL